MIPLLNMVADFRDTFRMLRLTYQRAQGLSSGYSVEQQQARSKDRNGKCSCRDSDVELANIVIGKMTPNGDLGLRTPRTGRLY
jgi:hypothetical protein